MRWKPIHGGIAFGFSLWTMLCLADEGPAGAAIESDSAIATAVIELDTDPTAEEQSAAQAPPAQALEAPVAQEAPPRPAVEEQTPDATTTLETSPAPEALAATATATATPELVGARALSLAFRRSAERTLPAVVTILTRSKEASAKQSAVLGIIGGEDEQIFDSMGSGVIISPDGLVLTNNHVIQNASRIDVRLADGRQFTAQDPVSDPASDVAILKIPGQHLPTAELGDSTDLFVGEWVLAIGSPFQIESSVSAGIISGTGRRRSLSSVVAGQFIQTDAAINPGNSGGPLIDLEGRVIGINTAISSRTGGFQGIGFAIPISRASWIKDELLEFGRVRRGYAGVRTSDVTLEVGDVSSSGAGRHSRPLGAYVRSVVPDYPAYLAGLKSGDIILEFADQRVDSKGDFAEIVQQSPLDKPLPIVIQRAGQRQTLTMTLVERPK
ncbi:putative periplasmic serine endoprotease DegP-like precursor [Aureliella helgolandensis]|uniref:Putative periplasmic serine endoprotease DegP-like n=2 Tax=Aureliella helgolandensis TaxID=2527968 RepID=A0A518G5D6_9BACT|nr:putative periplasmic serine endoprotease DegP-like precursor [Aureliella helgolandensis]